jgi:hypothetical protein
MTDDSMTDERMTGSKDTQGAGAADTVSIWGVIMVMAIAVLPFAVRNQDVVRAIAHMCGFDFG